MAGKSRTLLYKGVEVNDTYLFLFDILEKFVNDTNATTTSPVTATNTATIPPKPQLHWTERQVLFITWTIVVPILVSVGLVGNVINIVVLTRRWMHSSTNFYLTALAVCDIGYVVLFFIIALKHIFDDLPGTMVYAYLRTYSKPTMDAFSNTGIWIVVTFTIERFVAVGYPMKGKFWATTKKAKILIVINFVVVFGVTSLEYLEYGVIEKELKDRVIYLDGRTKLASHPFYALVYTNILMVLFTFLPLILLVIFNSLLVRFVLGAIKQREDLTNAPLRTMPEPTSEKRKNARNKRQKEQQRITIMLIAVVMVFLICQMPVASLHCYLSYKPRTNVTELLKPGALTTENYVVRIAGNHIGNALILLNASTNFLLYSFFSSKFRRTFKILFCGRAYKEKTTQIATVSNQNCTNTQATAANNVKSQAPAFRYENTLTVPENHYVRMNGSHSNQNHYVQMPLLPTHRNSSSYTSTEEIDMCVSTV